MSLQYNFQGRTVLVTGGGKGLGRAIVQKFVDAGCTSIFVLERNEEFIKELKNELPSVKALQVDVSDWKATKQAVESIGPVDHLVNNAGIPEVQDFLEVTPEGINRIFGVNFNAIVNISQVVAKGMIARKKGGTIVNVSSICDSKAIEGIPMYCCTKAAVNMLTKTMALELAPHDIRVNCVRPSVMLTGLITNPEKKHVAEHVFTSLMEHQVTKKVLTVEDTADSVLFLSSDASSMVNGSGVLLDGGLFTH